MTLAALDTMNGITEPLPGLLDDPQFQITDLPLLTDFQIAPLRNPAPSRPANIPLPLEPVAGHVLNNSRATGAAANPHCEGLAERKRAPKITPTDVLLAREAKKPHLAISELLEATDHSDPTPTQLPSFISLSVVEKSPIQAPTALEASPASKKRKLDGDGDHVALDSIRRLPRPSQKDDRQPRPAPLLPAMVTGLHEPPPSAALLPSIDVVRPPGVSRVNTTSKIHVKDILTVADQDPSAPSPPVPAAEHDVAASPRQPVDAVVTSPLDSGSATTESARSTAVWRDNKPRRTRRKWSESETSDLLAGVKKYGVGKWKQILDDPAFTFCDRSSVDLKDRYRVCANNDSLSRTEPALSRTPSGHDLVLLDTADVPPPPEREKVATPPPAKDAAPASKQRRKRRVWTAREDENLLKGVARHGFQWTLIHDDVELDLQHRRATDLRDRIRTKYPDGYRHAETAPLRSEARKADKDSTAAAVNTPPLATHADAPAKLASAAWANSPLSLSQVQNKTPLPVGAVNGVWRPTTATTRIQTVDRDRDGAKDKDQDRDKDKDQSYGVTLPSFTLEVEDGMDWEDNRLPPLHEWDDIGI